MANDIEIKVPDIGGAAQVDVIEVLVKVGDHIEVDTPLITLESDKASMEIPSPSAGLVSKISVKVGDKVTEGDLILLAQGVHAEQKEPSAAPAEVSAEQVIAEPIKKSEDAPQSIDVTIPDIGGATDVDVIDVLVKEGMEVKKDDSLVTLEGDKATMDIPSPYAGMITELKIKVGDKVSQGSLVLTMITLAKEQPSVNAVTLDAPNLQSNTPAVQSSPQPKSEPQRVAVPQLSDHATIAAGPAVRRLARELGVHLNLVKGTGRKSRITIEDIQTYVKNKLSETSTGGFSVPNNPVIDFSKFGEIETKALNKIKKLTGVNVHRSWITIPHVTQFDEADITDLDAFRKAESQHALEQGYKLTILAFVCGVVSKALQVFPQFNASLDASGDNLIYKKYCNIGIAVETPNGLVVPVIKNVDRMNVAEIAIQMAKLSTKARDKGLMPGDMSGGCFTISSLGGIGGTAFTPIVNSPEVAILGLSRSTIKPVYEQGEFKPRLMLPLSLSYDHRVIDGAEAARFTRFIADALFDIRKILL